jgi:hypothetical protein
MAKKLDHIINHVVLLLDASSSMSNLSDQVVKVVDAQIAYLARQSTTMNQETRVSIYVFHNSVECLIYDRDVLRLPSIKTIYDTDGMTALIDGAVQAIKDLKLIPQLYSDHAFLIYGWTDGQENHSSNTPATLTKLINGLDDNWTVGIFVPSNAGRAEAKRHGFPEANIEVWDTNAKGVEKVSDRIKTTTDTFMKARASGQRGLKTLFTVDAAALTKNDIKQSLTVLKPSSYELLQVRKDAPINEYVTSLLGSYTVGSGYYKLTKKETIQASKNIIIRERATGKAYAGDEARSLLGLPNTEIRVEPGDFGKWEIYVQSTSVNRKLIKGTDLIVLK